MKRISLTVILVLTIVGSLIAQNRMVNFEQGTLAEALAKAKAANKPVFFDGYAEWCPPCKYMITKVFTQDKVADFFNENFICIKVDLGKGEGKELSSKYKIQLLPTFLILDADGKMIHRIVGRHEAEPFIEMVKQGLNPETSLAKQAERYKNGNREPQFLLNYFNELKKASMREDAAPVALDYLSTLDDKDKATKECWLIYDQYANELLGKDFIYILSNRAKFNSIVGDSVVNEKISRVFTNKMMSLLSAAKYKEEAKKVKELIATYKPIDANRYVSYLKLADATANKKGSSIVALTDKLFTDFPLSIYERYYVLYNVVPVAVEVSSKNELKRLLKKVDDQVSKVQLTRKERTDYEKLKVQLVSKIDGSVNK